MQPKKNGGPIRMNMQNGGGFASMLKDGARHFSGLEEAVVKNIEACREFSKITRTSLGPQGRNKMVINHLEKLFVTSDASTITRELEVEHPAAKMIVHAMRMQEEEIGDGTNFIVVFAGELLQMAETLITMGLHPSEIVQGYNKACAKALEILETLSTFNVENPRDVNSVAHVLKAPIASKQYGYEDLLAPLVAQACIDVLPENPKNFNVDNVRVVKVMGSSVSESTVIKGMAMKGEPTGTVNTVENAKVVVYQTAVDTSQTETKGTVLIKDAESLKNYNKSEEEHIEKLIQGIADSGAKLIVSGEKIGEMAQHFIDRLGLMSIRILSKFELRRFCRTVGATPLMKLVPPTSEDLGMIGHAYVREIGDNRITIVEQTRDLSGISTVLVRAATKNMLDDVERAINDGVNTFKNLTRDGRFVTGAGATEIQLAQQVHKFGETCPGLDQYAITKFAEAFESIAKVLAENAGMNSTETVSSLYAAHAAGKTNTGVDIEESTVRDMSDSAILDAFPSKMWGIRLATDAATTVLKVDQIIMAKPAGGPKVPQQGARDF